LDSNEPLLHTIDALMQCSFLMNADLSTEVVLRQIIDEAKKLVGAEAASIFLVDAERQELYSNVNTTRGELRVPMTAGIAGHVATTGEPLIIDDAYADKRFNKSNDLKTGFRTCSMMCVPLKVKNDGVLGVVQLINKTGDGVLSRSQAHTGLADECSSRVTFTYHDLQFLQVFASQAATAVANSGGVLDETGLPYSSDDSQTEQGACETMDIGVVRQSSSRKVSKGSASPRKLSGGLASLGKDLQRESSRRKGSKESSTLETNIVSPSASSAKCATLSSSGKEPHSWACILRDNLASSRLMIQRSMMEAGKYVTDQEKLNTDSRQEQCTEPNKCCVVTQQSEGRKGSKRSGRARQRAAKWWAAVRQDTPSPDCVPARRWLSSPL
jgi:hypothetical protein